MKRLLTFLLLLAVSIGANAQFTNGQILTAQALNAALAAPTITAGSINGTPIGASVPTVGYFTNLTATIVTASSFVGPLSTSNANITGGSISGVSISGLTSPLPIASGGTGSNTPSTALANLGGLPLTGGTLTGPLTVPTLASSNATITGGTISGTPIAGSTGAFTVLSGTSETMTGSQTAAITSQGALAKHLSQPTVTGQSIYQGLCPGCTSYDNYQSTLTVPSGSTITTIGGVDSYINNLNGTGTPNTGNAVNYFSVATCGVNNAACWSANYVLADNTTYAISSVTGVQLNGQENDFDVTSPNTNVSGPNLTGSSLVQPAFAGGWTVSSLCVQAPTICKWTYAFITLDGVASTAAHWGAAAASGSNIASQPVTYNYFNSSGSEFAWSEQVSTAGNFTISDNGSGHSVQINDDLISKAPTGTGSVTVDNSGSQQSVALFNDGGSNKWQVGKNTNNNFFAYDTVGNALIWNMPTGGTFTFTPPVAFSAGASVTGNLTTTGRGAMPLYGTTGTGVNAPHMVQGSVALSSGTATVTLSGSAVYTSSSSYTCTANDATAVAAVKVGQTSGTSITFTGTGTDTVQFVCTGS